MQPCLPCTSLSVLLWLFASPPQLLAQQTRTLAGVVSSADKVSSRVRVTVFDVKFLDDSIEPLADTRADSKGRFTIRDAHWPSPDSWGRRTVVIIAVAENMMGLLEVRELGERIDTSRLSIPLHATMKVSGRVLNADGKPVEGATVWPDAIAVDGRHYFVSGGIPSWRVSTDKAGRFTLPGMPEKAQLQLDVRHPDYARLRIDVPDPSLPCELRLTPGGHIAGVVRLPDGKPASRATVIAVGGDTALGRAMTDLQGRYVIDSLPGETYNVYAEAADLTCIALEGVKVRPSETTETSAIQLVHGGFIVGRVSDEATGRAGRPHPMADVALYGPSRPRSGRSCDSAPVREDGTFRIRAAPGSNYIYFRAGFDFDVVVVGEGKTVHVEEGKETQVEFHYRRKAK